MLRRNVLAVFSAAAPALVMAQTPPAPSHSYSIPTEPKTLQTLRQTPEPKVTPDPNRIYTLAELVDLAETNNPATRSAWENAKAQAAQLGIARSALYPSIAAAALAMTTRQGILFGDTFVRQTEGLYQAQVEVNCLIFDFGERQSRIQSSRANLGAANFGFNNVHLEIIYRTTAACYQLLSRSHERTNGAAGRGKPVGKWPLDAAGCARSTQLGRPIRL